jgi:hypothetical protein
MRSSAAAAGVLQAVGLYSWQPPSGLHGVLPDLCLFEQQWDADSPSNNGSTPTYNITQV